MKGKGLRSAVPQCPGKLQRGKRGKEADPSSALANLLGCNGVRRGGVGVVALFGSVSATRVTSHCPAGTVGLGGLGDKAGFLPAHLQAPLASASVCSTCALGLGTLPGAGRCRDDCLSGPASGRARWRWRSLAGLSGQGWDCLRLLRRVGHRPPFSTLRSSRAPPYLGSFWRPERAGGPAWGAFLASELWPGLSPQRKEP